MQRPLRQKTVGVLGGMSNEATAEYYRMLNERVNAKLGGWDNAEIVMVSVNFGNIQSFVRDGKWDEASSYLCGKLDALEAAGADVIVCVSNTVHRVVTPLMQGRATPFLHIADATGEAIRTAGLTKVGLLGTMGTMRSDAYAARFMDGFGIELVVPEKADALSVDRIIFDELVRRELRPGSKAEYLRIVGRLRERGAQGVVLGCTEIFLLIGPEDLPGFPVFDTASLHVDAAVAFVLG